MRQTRKATNNIAVLPPEQDDDAAAQRFSAASDPQTDPLRLQAMGVGDDASLCIAVAANPNTPWETLRLLAPRYPQAFLANPALPLLLLENPRIFHDVAEETVLILLAQETLPVTFLSAIATYPGAMVKAALAAHVQLHGECGAAWEDEAAAVIHQREFTILARHHMPLPGFLYNTEHTAPWLLDLLARHPRAPVRNLVATASGLSTALQEALAVDASAMVRYTLVANPATDDTILARLAQSEDIYIRRNMLRNPNLMPALVAQLAEVEDYEVRNRASEHPHMPIEVLEHLPIHESSRQAALAGHPKTPEPLLQQMIKDSLYFLRLFLAKNPLTPPHVLAAIAHESDWRLRMAVGANPQLPVAAMQRLAIDKNSGVRARLAANPQLPIDIIEKLAKSRSDTMLMYLARNPQTPHKILERLVKRDHAVCIAALQNPTITVAMRHRWTATLLQDLAAAKAPHGEDNSIVHMLALASPLQSPAALAQQAQQEGDWLLRFVIAHHAATPATTLAALARDGNRYVRAAARAGLAANAGDDLAGT